MDKGRIRASVNHTVGYRHAPAKNGPPDILDEAKYEQIATILSESPYYHKKRGHIITDNELASLSVVLLGKIPENFGFGTLNDAEEYILSLQFRKQDKDQEAFPGHLER